MRQPKVPWLAGGSGAQVPNHANKGLLAARELANPWLVTLDLPPARRSAARSRWHAKDGAMHRIVAAGVYLRPLRRTTLDELTAAMDDGGADTGAGRDPELAGPSYHPSRHATRGIIRHPTVASRGR